MFAFRVGTYMSKQVAYTRSVANIYNNLIITPIHKKLNRIFDKNNQNTAYSFTQLPVA